MFYIAIIGLTKVDDFDFFRERCIYYLREKAKGGITILTTEEHPFVDRFASMYRINTRVFYAEWNKYGREAKKKRNYEMLTHANGVISFNDGTTDCEMLKNLAKELGLPVRNPVKPAT